MAIVLVIDDNETVRSGVAAALERAGHAVRTAADGDEGLAMVRGADPIDLVITDLRMDGLDGMEVLRRVHAFDAELPVVVITAHGTVQTAVEAMAAGAADFVEKPFPAELLRTRVQRALDVRAERARGARLERENEILRDEARPVHGDALDALLGTSDCMERLRHLILRVAPTDSTVLVTGESGTGKELVATAIHETSRRASGPMVRVNCAAIADTLLESELFGHEKGAFTDARSRRLGRFELADGGTLFLDEIGDISPAMQVRLLRVLQEQTFERVGGEKPVRVDVRLVAATNRDLKQDVADGRFREDLYYRLNIIPLAIPPLRERVGDIDLLARAFVARLAPRTRARARDVSEAALAVLRAAPWRGNVRELENVIEQSLVFAEGDRIEVDDLPAHLVGRRADDALPVPDGDRSLPEILEDLERRLIERALEQAQGVKTETARLLGIKTPALYYKLEKYGLGDRGGSSDS